MDNNENKDNPTSNNSSPYFDQLLENYSNIQSMTKYVDVDLFTEDQLRQAGAINHRTETIEHPNRIISDGITLLSDSFLRLNSVKRRFNYEFNKYLIDNSELAFLFSEFAETFPKDLLTKGDLNISEILSYSHNPRLQKLIGNAISRAQIADQFEHRHIQQKYKDGKLEQIGASDKLPFALMDNLFTEETLILVSSGSPKLGQEVSVDSASQLLEKLFGNEMAESLVASVRAPYQGKFIHAKGSRKVPHTNGSFKMAKKLDHSIDAKPPFRSNFPFDAIAKALRVPGIRNIHRGQTTKLDIERCKDLQELFASLAEYTIRSVLPISRNNDLVDENEIISGPQTIIIRDTSIEMINYLGQGIKFSKPTDGNMGMISLIGFSDTQSITERDQDHNHNGVNNDKKDKTLYYEYIKRLGVDEATTL